MQEDGQDLNLYLFLLEDVEYHGLKLELDVYLVQDQQLSQPTLNVHFILYHPMHLLMSNVKEYFVVAILELTVNHLNHHGLGDQ